jgi:hypothetical protein
MINDARNPLVNSPWIVFIHQLLDPTGTVGCSAMPDEDGEPSYALLQWDSEDVPKPTEAEFLAAADEAKAMTYKIHRRQAYPPITEQLDMMFHDPELWRSAIQAVKDKHPKPSAK